MAGPEAHASIPDPTLSPVSDDFQVFNFSSHVGGCTLTLCLPTVLFTANCKQPSKDLMSISYIWHTNRPDLAPTHETHLLMIPPPVELRRTQLPFDRTKSSSFRRSTRSARLGRGSTRHTVDSMELGTTWTLWALRGNFTT
jgi:hypothetical protein